MVDKKISLPILIKDKKIAFFLHQGHAMFLKQTSGDANEKTRRTLKARNKKNPLLGLQHSQKVDFSIIEKKG